MASQENKMEARTGIEPMYTVLQTSRITTPATGPR